MKPQIVPFVEVPSLLEEGEKVVVASKSSLRRAYQKAFLLRESQGFPFFLYHITSCEPDEKTLHRTKQSEKELMAYWRKEYASALGRDILALFLYVLLSYAIWNIGVIFEAVDALFMLAGDYLNPYARVVLILAPLVYGVYHKFLVGDTIFAKQRAFAFLKLQPYLERSAKVDFIRDLRKFARTFTRPVRDVLRALVEAIDQGDKEKVFHLVDELRRQPCPLGERKRIASLCSELELFLAGDFSPQIYQVELSEALASFFSSSTYKDLSARIRHLVQNLPQSLSSLDTAVALLEQVLCQTVRGKIADSVLEAILEYYQDMKATFSPQRKAWETLSFPKAVFWGFVLVALSFFLFSLHLVDLDDFLIVRSLRLGWQGLFGERLEVVDRGVRIGSKKLLFVTPKPFSFAHRATRSPQSVNAFLLLREVAPTPSGGILGTLRYLWEKGMAFFKEGYGDDFIVLRFSFTFEIIDPERWKHYDFDGRGKERLSRDLETYLLGYLDRVREKYRQALFEDEYEGARAKLEEISRSRAFREWIRRFLYPSPLDMYRVGSVYDMYLVGLEWLRRHPYMEENPEWQKFVDHEIALIREKMQKEHDELIADPFRVRDIVRNPNVLVLSEYPGLYQTLLLMALNEVVMGMLIEDLGREESRKAFGEETLQYLTEHSDLFSNIGIALRGAWVSLEKVSYLYYLRYLQKRQNLL
ncbi:hypothetical protein [Candidatus Caldatribacterium sp.]|uniref:hypothetical protein n=1 Tax=Candidatus Caldatribacterium sp. TaxID=2282143 RepID=UPI003843C423|nr:hypothetical protein [Candidatus Caldatribacterium sp.]